MQINKQSRNPKGAKSILKSVREGVRNFFTPERKRALKSGSIQFFEASETILGYAAHPRKTYRALPRIGKFAVVAGIAIGSHFGLLHLNKQEQKNKIKALVREQILANDAPLYEEEVVQANAREAERNATALLTTLTPDEFYQYKAQEAAANFVAYSIVYKESQVIGSYYQELLDNPPRELTAQNRIDIQDSINVIVQRGQACGGAALVALEEFGETMKDCIAPEISLNSNGTPNIIPGNRSAIGTSAYEAYQQTVGLFVRAFEEIGHLAQRHRDKDVQPLKHGLK